MCSGKERKSVLKRPLFTAAIMQAVAAVVSVLCIGMGTGEIFRTVFIALFTGIILLSVFAVYIFFNKVPVYNFLIILIYPVTVFETLIVSMSLHKNYGYEEFSGSIKSIVCKEDYTMLYMKKNSLNSQGIIVYIDNDDKLLNVGDKISVCGEVKIWDVSRNPGNFDSDIYYTSCGYPYKCKAEKIVVLSSDKDSFYSVLYRIKQQFKRVYEYVFDEDNNQLMNSMILGDKYELDSDIKEMYKKSGMSHLLAISGIHISIVGMSIYRLLRKCFNQIVSALAGIIVILSYLVFTGESISAARAVCMLIIVIIADIRARTYDMVTALSLASLMQIGANPYVVCNMSYIMSFLAMSGIALVLPVISSKDKTLGFIMKKDRKKRRIIDELIYVLCDSISGCIAVQLTLLPAVLYYSFEISLISMVFNCIVIPLMPVVMISGMITGIAGLISIKPAIFFAGAASYILNIYNYLCKFAEKLPWSVYVTGRPQVWQIILYIVLLCMWVFINSQSVKYYIRERFITRLKDTDYLKLCNILMVIVIALGIVNMRYVKPDGVFIMMLDVGQGDCIYIKDENGISYLFDGGSTDVKNVGKYRIYPTLRAMGIKCIDYVIISHCDADHINGIKELIDMCNDTFTIGEVVLPDIIDKEKNASYMDIVEYVGKADIKLEFSKAGDIITDDESGFNITCIHPCESYVYEDANDYSAVYRICYGEFSMLMMGDAGQKAERCIMKDWKGKYYTSVLKAGHHGSKYSTSEEFLEYINPMTALISCGIDNRYGHPHTDTLEKLGNEGINVYRTDKYGAITIHISKKGNKQSSRQNMKVIKYLQQ